MWPKGRDDEKKEPLRNRPRHCLPCERQAQRDAVPPTVFSIEVFEGRIVGERETKATNSVTDRSRSEVEGVLFWFHTGDVDDARQCSGDY